MTFAIILACTVAACFALRNPIKKWPMLFYALAVIIDLVYVVGSFYELPRAVWIVLFTLIQKCTLSLAIFIVVMYVGVFAKGSKPYMWLKGIRAELSIIAWILSLGHMVVYLMSYVPRIFGGGIIKGNVMFAFVLAVVLFVLLIVLGVTSFNFVKKRMDNDSWVKLQKLAYLFYALVYIHLLAMLLPAALHGGIQAGITTGVYSVVFIAYAVLRVYRALADRRAGIAD
ncbi:ferric reductase-like transmembrane domain-containing protein [Adlercreutzia sp. ZJ141]|uniref:ferric reductase-like transmembrane domain-containing protein n=1 Tax=Adlercreutzia sp. ZJ141 TaxID=2709406 RepID=UPI0013EBF4E8|nr:ferric reductase-like transmembrane domain-containing protein [Adlercreutzia sp. ZJ141]